MKGIAITIGLLIYLGVFLHPGIGNRPHPQPSGVFRAIAYDTTNQLLRLTFRSGHCYEYLDVPASCHAKLLRTPSQGSYYNRHIRGRYAMRRHTLNRLKEFP